MDARAAGLRLALAGLLLAPATDAAIAQAQRTFDCPKPRWRRCSMRSRRRTTTPCSRSSAPSTRTQILGEDRDAARDEQARFVAAANQSLELRPDGQDRRIAYVGPRAWPLPIPIVLEGGAWRFDTEAGIDELANQRIGGNELRTIDDDARLCGGAERVCQRGSRRRRGARIRPASPQLARPAGRSVLADQRRRGAEPGRAAPRGRGRGARCRRFLQWLPLPDPDRSGRRTRPAAPTTT